MDLNSLVIQDDNNNESSETITLTPKAPESKDVPYKNMNEYLYQKYYNEDGSAKEVKEESKEEVKEDEPAKPKEDVKEESKTQEEDTEDKPKEESTQENPDDFYTLDEIDDDDDEPVVNDLPQDVKTYVYDKLPVIKANIVVDGQPQTVSIKIPSQLPANFEFASKQEEVIFNNSLAEQTQNATNLQNEYFNKQNEISMEQFRHAENKEIKDDIASLQRDGLLPTFTKNTSVDSDSRAELARKVLEFYETENSRRLQESNNSGRPFSRITYRDAFEKYVAKNPIKKADDKTAKELAKEDAERKEITSKNSILNRNSAGDTSKDDSPKVPRTRNLSDMTPYLTQKYKLRG